MMRGAYKSVGHGVRVTLAVIEGLTPSVRLLVAVVLLVAVEVGAV
jgi:hypothetical protein